MKKIFPAMLHKTLPCPVCGKPVGLGAVAKAPVPSRIKCSSCGSRLKPDGKNGLFIAAGVLLGMLVGAPVCLTTFAISYRLAGIGIAVTCSLLSFVLVVLLCDLPINLYVLHKRKLEAVKAQK